MRISWFMFPIVLLALVGAGQPESSSLGISFRGQGPYRDSSLVRVTLGEGRNARQIEGRRFRSGQDSVNGYDPTPHLGPIPVATHGTLPIRVDLVSSAGDTLSTLHASLQLQPRYDYGITIFAGYSRRPETMCTVETYAAPMRNGLRSRAADSMFVLISGLPVDAVC